MSRYNWKSQLKNKRVWKKRNWKSPGVLKSEQPIFEDKLSHVFAPFEVRPIVTFSRHLTADMGLTQIVGFNTHDRTHRRKKILHSKKRTRERDAKATRLLL